MDQNNIDVPHDKNNSQNASLQNPSIYSNEQMNYTYSTNYQSIQRTAQPVISQQRDWIVMLILFLFVGAFGAHRFYTKHYLIGAIYVLTICPTFFIVPAIMWFIDLFLIVTGKYEYDAEGIPLKK